MVNEHMRYCDLEYFNSCRVVMERRFYHLNSEKMQFKLKSMTIIKLNSQFTPKLQKNLYEMWSLHAFEPQFLLSVSCHKPDT